MQLYDILTVNNAFQSVAHITEYKVNFTLEQATKAQRGETRYSSILSLTSALDGGEWSTPRPGRFNLGKEPLPIV
jgi:hypothetical protein